MIAAMPGSIFSRSSANDAGNTNSSVNASIGNIPSDPAAPVTEDDPVRACAPMTPQASVSVDPMVMPTATAPAPAPAVAVGRLTPHAIADTMGIATIISPSCAALTLRGRTHYRAEKANQDAFAALPEDGIFVVADGHGVRGDILATTAVNVLVSALLDALPKVPADGSVKSVLRMAFATAADRIDRMPEAERSGTTASVAILRGSMLTVANIGDSCVFLAGPGVARRLSVAHKGTDDAEARRVEEAGGQMFFGFVYAPEDADGKVGALAITRAFGDKRFAGISRIPHIEEAVVDKGQVVVMASDGVWDAHSAFHPAAVCKMVMEKAKVNGAGEALRRAAAAVLDRSRSVPNHDSELPEDDLTVVLVRPGEAQHAQNGVARVDEEDRVVAQA